MADKSFDDIIKELDRAKNDWVVQKTDGLAGLITMVPIPGMNIEMLTTPVTQKLYSAVMGHNPSHFKGMGDDLPVENIGWGGAVRFCNKMSTMFGLTPVYIIFKKENTKYEEVTQNASANGFRLPTKLEWEHAAKGGAKYKYAGSSCIDNVAWYRCNSCKMPHPVGQKKPNGYGLYDMSGNVWEWCWTPFKSLNKNDESYRYIRGGSWNSGEYDSYYCEVSPKFDMNFYSNEKGIRLESEYSSDVGFRIVRNIKWVPTLTLAELFDKKV